MQRFASTTVEVLEEQRQPDAALPTEDQPQPKSTGKRLLFLDIFRGLIMVIMAWDHTKDILVKKTWSDKGFEGWQGPYEGYDNDWWWFIARAVSNVCAPGFFFTMGISMSLFTLSRVNSGWGHGQILKHFLVRGIVLLIIGRLVDAPFLIATIVRVTVKGETVETWNGVYSRDNESALWRDTWLGVFEVMTGLGLVMISASLFLFPMHLLYERDAKANSQATVPLLERDGIAERIDSASSWLRPSLPEFVSYFSALVVYIVSNITIVTYQGDDFFTSDNSTFPKFKFRAENFGQALVRLVIIPGALPLPFGVATYPIIPWIGITLLGIGIGFSMKRHSKSTVARIGIMGVVFLIGFGFVRAFGGKVGNFRGWPRGDGHREGDCQHEDPLLGFFTMSKYPPSMSFTLFYIGIDNLILYMFFKLCERDEGTRFVSIRQFFWQTLKTFGEVPLFFYFCHFWILGLFSGLLALTSDTFKFPLPICAIFWLLLLSVLRPICQAYGVFKATTPRNSIWRYL